jgi:putative tributyrin esterase
MSRTRFLIAILLLLSTCTFAADQAVFAKNITTVAFQSESLGQSRTVSILLPGDYETSTRRYPVLYLLHGYGDDHTTWAVRTNLTQYATTHRLIVVMPDGSKSFYVNSAADPKARFEDFIVKDLISYVDAHYRTIPLRRARAIAGLSMGGYGAAFLGLKHRDRFAALASFSGAVGIAHQTPGTDPNSTIKGRVRSDIEALLGPPGSTARRERDPFALIEKIPASELPSIYIACGGQDFLLAQNRAFVDFLAQKKIPYEYREVSPRIHEWDFWDEQIPIFLNILKQSGCER